MAQAVASFSEAGDEDDAAFLSAIAEAEADGMRRLSQDGVLSRKLDRQRSQPAESVSSSLPSVHGVGSGDSHFGDQDGVHSYNENAAAPKRSRIEPEGEYMAALRGNHSETWQALSSKVGPDVKRRYGAAASHSTSANLGGGDGTGREGNTTGGCFHCGKDGHWARDCPSKGSMTSSSWGLDGSNASGQTAQVPQRACPCGAGTCVVLTANTEKNAGRQFYKCPLRKEEGQCGFFEWCDGITSSSQGGFKEQGTSHKQAEFPCPCGAGLCVILTAKTEKNMGRQFYRCPLNQGEGYCGFFKWCDESGPASGTAVLGCGRSTLGERVAMLNVASGQCYKCGMDGHWAKDCTVAGQNASTKGYGGGMRTGQIEGGGTGGTCYKCNQAGHWATNCPNQQSSWGGPVGGFNRQGGYGSPGSGGRNAGVVKSASSGGCFKCGSDGHWSKDCPDASNTRLSGGYSQAAYGGRSSFSGKSGGGGSCYKCGGQGHWASDCRADGKGGRNMY